jgi:N-methylhydantoinase A
MRYLGQNYEHEIELADGALTDEQLQAAFRRFDEMHERRYGYRIEGETIELVSFKVSAIGRRPQAALVDSSESSTHERTTRPVFFRGDGFVETAVIHRSALEPDEIVAGPALVQEAGSTTLVAPGMSVHKTRHGSLLITTGESA